MKALVIFLLPAMMLIGCGQMSTNEDTAQNVLANMSEQGSLSDADIASVDEDLLNETVEMTETGSNSVMLKLGGAELLIDFIENLSDDPADTAMIINGVEVATSIVSDPSSLQGLIASLVTSQLQDVDILGIPATDLVQAGIGLINGDTSAANFSNLFGTLVRGVFNNFLSGSPFGAIFSQIAGPILGDLGGDAPAAGSNGQQQNNNSGSGVLNTIVNTIGGGAAAANPLLGGLFSLISNLFK